MSKIVFLLLLVCVATTWAVAMNCQSCGQECMPACGTRYFRTCCFNYLRKKRGSHLNKVPYLQNDGLFIPSVRFDDLDSWAQHSEELYDA